MAVNAFMIEANGLWLMELRAFLTAIMHHYKKSPRRGYLDHDVIAMSLNIQKAALEITTALRIPGGMYANVRSTFKLWPCSTLSWGNSPGEVWGDWLIDLRRSATVEVVDVENPEGLPVSQEGMDYVADKLRKTRTVPPTLSLPQPCKNAVYASQKWEKEFLDGEWRIRTETGEHITPITETEFVFPG